MTKSLKKIIKSTQLKIYAPANFEKTDFDKPDKINFELLKKVLWLTKDNSDFDFGRPKSGNIRTASIEIKNKILKLKEFVIEDQSSIRAYVEVHMSLNNLGEWKVINLSISEYKGCYCDLESSCEEVTTNFFPDNQQIKKTFSYPNGCWNQGVFFINE
ncbi:hypothetical protein [Aquimarina algicola]|uniref:Uncharacterized protein n=1 Tax=Aquimarina algicola TaxID=2589995 RepID=A0A504J504_9FLAO|nr:hypothetical protein [Aquimarina algicola]TPN85986.1 hypothetical protein FHK87_11945 [Aquimarina algicola]